WSEIKSDLESFIRTAEQNGQSSSIADLQEKLLGEELNKKAKETTGSTPQNFMINLQTPGTVPLRGPEPDDDDEDDVATRAHDIPQTSGSAQKDTRIDTRPGPQRDKVTAPPERKPELRPAPPKKKTPLVAMALAIGLVAGLAGVLSQQAPSLAPTAPPKVEAPAPQKIPLAIQVNGPTGATVSIDGNIAPQKAPTVLDNLAHGEHRLILTKDGYPPIKQTVTLDGSVNPLIVNPALPPAFATLVLTSRPTKVGIYENGILIGSTGETPLSLTPGVTHNLVLKKTGYKSFQLPLAPKAGQTIEQKIVLKRSKVKTKRKPAATPQPATPQSTPAAQPETIVQTKTIVIEDKLGFLTLRTKPWSNVFIDGKPYGPTPFSKRKLKAGKHTIKMDYKLEDGTATSTTRTITIESGKTKKINWKLTP
ncbi:MAG: PEGA domain-containing protein, partial [Deltaproteobacteria bacterium]|nr:PEGA domain-containing protein [Deltaproteobacteria bacterium]